MQIYGVKTPLFSSRENHNREFKVISTQNIFLFRDLTLLLSQINHTNEITFMLKVGRIQKLTVSRLSDFGLYLQDDEQNEVLLPNRYTSLSDKVGDEKEVFIYHDSEDRLVATTETPTIKVGEAAFLKVVDKTLHGAFLDWGLFGKDLFLPNRNQQGGIIPGKSYIVYAYQDSITERCVATCKLKSFINNDVITVEPREKVNLLVASESPIGFRVIINNRHWGMIYHDQLFQKVEVGDHLEGYIRRITEDNRIDVSLQQGGYAQVKDSATILRKMLQDNKGFLPINDNSTPEKIKQLTQMSKKTFKRSLGTMLKSGEVEMTDEGIQLKRR